eukprot:4662919-Amphidinium_carterae.1
MIAICVLLPQRLTSCGQMNARKHGRLYLPARAWYQYGLSVLVPRLQRAIAEVCADGFVAGDDCLQSNAAHTDAISSAAPFFFASGPCTTQHATADHRSSTFFRFVGTTVSFGWRNIGQGSTFLEKRGSYISDQLSRGVLSTLEDARKGSFRSPAAGCIWGSLPLKPIHFKSEDESVLSQVVPGIQKPTANQVP